MLLTMVEHAPERTWRTRAWLGGLVVALSLYGATLAPGLLWGDSGYAHLHTALDGWLVDGDIARSHVVYYALARGLLWLLPIGPARAANLMAMFCGALTIANVAFLCASFCRTKTAVFAGTTLLLFSHTLWRLSAAAEVVTLSTALLSAELIFFVVFVESRRRGWLYLALFTNGVGVSNHNFALLMWPVYGVIALRWWSAWSDRRLRTALTGCAALLLGMVPVLVLCADDWIAGGSLPATLKSWLVGQVGKRVLNVQSVLQPAVRGLGSGVLNFPTPLLILAIPGIVLFYRKAEKPVAWLFIGAFMVYAVFGIRYNVPDQYTFLVPAFLFLPIFIAVALDAVFSASAGRSARVLACMCVLMVPAVYAALPPLLRSYGPDVGPMPKRQVPYRDRYDWFLRPWLTGYDGAELFARETLKALPPDAWLVLDSTLVPPLNYLQVVEGLRKDVRLDSWAARQDWLPQVDADRAREEKLTVGLLFSAVDDPKYMPPWLRDGEFQLERLGYVFHVTRVPRP